MFPSVSSMTGSGGVLLGHVVVFTNSVDQLRLSFVDCCPGLPLSSNDARTKSPSAAPLTEAPDVPCICARIQARAPGGSTGSIVRHVGFEWKCPCGTH